MEGDYQNIDWSAALSEMEAKRDALNVAIEGLRAALEAGSLPGGSAGPSSPSPAPNAPKAQGTKTIATGKPIPLPRGVLLGKTGPEAIKLYLRSAMAKKTNKEIGDALKQGGVESTSKNFDTFINSALFRLKESGEVLRFDDGWGLSEWYPESFRTRVAEKAGNGKRRSKRRSSGNAKKASSQAKTSPASPKSENVKKVGLDQKILDLFGGDYKVAGSAANISHQLGIALPTVNLALGRLMAKGKIKKIGPPDAREFALYGGIATD